MIVTCPQCKVRFVVAPTAIGEDGRRVQCSQCRAVWFESPLPEEESPASEATITPVRATKKTKTTKPTTKTAQTSAPLSSHNPGGEGDTKSHPHSSGARNQQMVARWGVLAALFVGLAGALYFLRDELSKGYEPAARLYEKWDVMVLGKTPHVPKPTPALVIRQPHPSNYLELHHSAHIRFANNIPSLFLNLEIVNSAAFDITLPPVRGVIRDRSGAVIHSWWSVLETSVVAAKERVQTEVVVDPLPEDAVSAELFFDWN